MFHVRFLPTVDLGLTQFFKEINVLRTGPEVWSKCVIFVVDFSLGRVPIKLHNIAPWCLVFHYSVPPKIWGPGVMKQNEQKKKGSLSLEYF